VARSTREKKKGSGSYAQKFDQSKKKRKWKSISGIIKKR